MERQVVQDLLRCFLEKRGVQGIDLCKELEELLAYGIAKGCFADPNTVFDKEEWRRFGDKIWTAVLDEDKIAKKLGKAWRAVMNALQQHHAEQQAARAASERLGSVAGTAAAGGAEKVSPYPLPPSMNKILIPPGMLGGQGVEPSAPPVPPSSSPSLRPSSPLREESCPLAPSGSGEGARLVAAAEPDTSEAQRLAVERRKMWQQIAGQAVSDGDQGASEALYQAFRVVYAPTVNGGVAATITSLDWKLLSQLRSTVNESGIHGEPSRQMLDYMWEQGLLLPSDIQSIMRLILTQHQQLLFNAHWQAVCQESVAVQRQPGDPLHGVTIEELLGIGAFLRVEAQALLGPDKLREGMRLARIALDRVKSPGGIPSYMGVKQGRDEPFGSFVDRVANAIQSAGVPEHMHRALLQQCALQNGNATTRSVIMTLPGNWSIEELLERMAQVPSGPQAMLVNAIKELGVGLKQQAQAAQSQVLAALAPLR
ncbi:POK9 protein, partial [Ptilonorhynchus violaceus]|nr:POK9 protein [Ptilonorhynchus violaceus]